MNAKVLALILLFCSLSLHAQTPSVKPQPATQEDELKKHLSAAETYQISGDLGNALTENRAVVAVALQRMGNAAIEEGRYPEAVKLLTDSKNYAATPRVRIDLAIAHLRLNQTDKALEEARSAVEADPKFAYARYILGNIYFNKEDYRSALPELEKVFVAAPNFDVAYALGLTYLNLKELDRAKLLFEEIQTTFKKETAEFRILLGQAYEKTNYPAEAEREFKRALAVNPKQAKANFFLGYVILQHGGSERLAEAGRAFADELKISPEDFYANFFAGVVASSLNDHRQAVVYFDKAARLNPGKAETFLFLGQSQLELNELAAAEKNLRQAIALTKEETANGFQSRRTRFLLGRLLIRTGRKEEGEKELKIARDLQEKLISAARDEISQILGQVVAPTNPKTGNAESAVIKLPPERAAEIGKIKLYLSDILAQAFHNIAVIAVQSGNAGEALENFAAASRWKPDFAGLDRNWGIVSFRAGQFDKAIAPLARHLKANPQDKLVRQLLGTSYHFTRDFARSVETLKPLETELLSKPELAYFYGLSLVQLKRNREAAPVFNKLAEASQKNPEALFYAAQGFMIMGDHERAVKEFRTVAANAPNAAKVNYYIGQSLIRLNRYEEAEKAFARELELNPADASSKYHLALTLIERKIETEKTVAMLEEAISLKYDYADARYQLGKIFLEKGETQKAIEQLEASVAADPEKDFTHYQLSIAYRKAGRREDADRELKRYQDLKAANRSKNDSPMGIDDKNPE
jgi:tetratricopeptide (TPR) repeat protein